MELLSSVPKSVANLQRFLSPLDGPGRKLPGFGLILTDFSCCDMSKSFKQSIVSHGVIHSSVHTVLPLKPLVSSVMFLNLHNWLLRNNVFYEDFTSRFLAVRVTDQPQH